jgi:hypothetical protein
LSKTGVHASRVFDEMGSYHSVTAGATLTWSVEDIPDDCQPVENSSKTTLRCPTVGFQDDLPVTKLDDTPVTNVDEVAGPGDILMSSSSELVNKNFFTDHGLQENGHTSGDVFVPSQAASTELTTISMQDISALSEVEENKQTEDTDAKESNAWFNANDVEHKMQTTKEMAAAKSTCSVEKVVTTKLHNISRSATFVLVVPPSRSFEKLKFQI